MFQRLAAEFIGTLWLVLGGCGSAVLAAAFPNVGIGLLGVSFAFGLTVLTTTYAADRWRCTGGRGLSLGRRRQA
jgi:aquaporin Z